MASDPTADFSLDFFAEKFNITPSYFSRLFHRSVGVPFKEYLTAVRLEYAKQLLAENVLPIIDVGYECGFNTPSQFYRAFKKESGMTPSEYRKKKKIAL
jgi:two-component system response regulator YesN